MWATCAFTGWALTYIFVFVLVFLLFLWLLKWWGVLRIREREEEWSRVKALNLDDLFLTTKLLYCLHSTHVKPCEKNTTHMNSLHWSDSGKKHTKGHNVLTWGYVTKPTDSTDKPTESNIPDLVQPWEWLEWRIFPHYTAKQKWHFVFWDKSEPKIVQTMFWLDHGSSITLCSFLSKSNPTDSKVGNVPSQQQKQKHD